MKKLLSLPPNLVGCFHDITGYDKKVEKIEEGIRNVFGKKGDAIVEMNLKAFRAGLQVADEHINK